jgi:hypothetical protein
LILCEFYTNAFSSVERTFRDLGFGPELRAKMLEMAGKLAAQLAEKSLVRC